MDVRSFLLVAACWCGTSAYDDACLFGLGLVQHTCGPHTAKHSAMAGLVKGRDPTSGALTGLKQDKLYEGACPLPTLTYALARRINNDPITGRATLDVTLAECDQAQCDDIPHASSCYVTPYTLSRGCTCDDGYYMHATDVTCVDANECSDASLNACHVGRATCDDTPPGSYSCECNVAYAGNGEVCIDLHWNAADLILGREPEGYSNDMFGTSVSLSGNGSVKVVGGPYENTYGRVHVYKGDAVPLVLEPEGEPPPSGTKFGMSVSVSHDGNTIAVGSTASAAYTAAGGFVDVFRWDGSTYVRRVHLDRSSVTYPDGSIETFAAFDNPNGRFGIAVSLSGDGNVLAVGARNWHVDGTDDSGLVAVYTWNETTYVPREGNLVDLSAPHKGHFPTAVAYSDYTGTSVSLNYDGSVVAIGSEQSSGPGFVDVFQWGSVGPGNGWIGIFHHKATEWGTRYGGSVSLNRDGTVVAVGAWKHNGSRGSVFVYARDATGTSWSERGVPLQGTDGQDDQFGVSVSLSGDGTMAAVGAPQRDNNQISNAGSVKVFTWQQNAWVQQGDELYGPQEDAMMGRAVSLSSDGTVVVGGTPQIASTQRGGVQSYTCTDDGGSGTCSALGLGWGGEA